jgi:hypothetical protein
MNGNPFLTDKIGAIGGYGKDPLEVSRDLKSEFKSAEFLEIPSELYDTYILERATPQTQGLVNSTRKIEFFQHIASDIYPLGTKAITNNLERVKVAQGRAYLFNAMCLQIFSEQKPLTDIKAYESVFSSLYAHAWLLFQMDRYDVFEVPISRVISDYPHTRGDDNLVAPYLYYFGKNLYLRQAMPFSVVIDTDGTAITMPESQTPIRLFIRFSFTGMEYRPPSQT